MNNIGRTIRLRVSHIKSHLMEYKAFNKLNLNYHIRRSFVAMRTVYDVLRKKNVITNPPSFYENIWVWLYEVRKPNFNFVCQNLENAL